jgi:hypothetical protein
MGCTIILPDASAVHCNIFLPVMANFHQDWPAWLPPHFCLWLRHYLDARKYVSSWCPCGLGSMIHRHWNRQIRVRSGITAGRLLGFYIRHHGTVLYGKRARLSADSSFSVNFLANCDIGALPQCNTRRDNEKQPRSDPDNPRW